MYRSHGVRRIRIGRDGFGDTEISHLHLALSGNDDILRLDIPMYNLIVMGNLQT